MKNIKFVIFAFLLFVVSSCFQQKKYVSYKIKEGETMSSVAKKYGMSEAELLQINPGIGKKPSPNTVIIVPETNNTTQKKEAEKEEVEETVKKEYATYTVEKGDTLFSLSKRFGMTIDELKQENPILLESELKTGMELLYIKNNPNMEVIDDKSDLENYETHNVIKGDTIYNLTHRYEISEEELYSLNPQLSDGLKVGMTLKIRKKEIVDESENEIEDISKDNTSLLVEDFTTGKSVDIAVMLPYQLNTLNNDKTITKRLENENSLTNIATDFHQGITMAIDSLKGRGVQINVDFFDTENSQLKLGKLILKNSFSDYDAIIGPLFFDNAKLLANQVDIPVVMPFYSKKQIGISSENLIKSMPSQKKIEEKLLNYLRENHSGEKILVVTDNKDQSKSQLWRVVNELKSFGINNLSVLKPKKGYIDRERFNEEIKKEVSNWVLLIGDDVVTTSDVVNNLGVFPKDSYRIKLFSFEKGNNFNKVNNFYLGRLQFTYPTSTYDDVFNNKVRKFYKKFKEENNTLPSKYALRGFDVAYDVITRIASYGNLSEGLQQGKSSRLNSVFNYNSTQNEGVILVQYNEDLQPEVVE